MKKKSQSSRMQHIDKQRIQGATPDELYNIVGRKQRGHSDHTKQVQSLYQVYHQMRDGRKA